MTSGKLIRLAIFIPHMGMSGAEGNVASLLQHLSPDQFDISLFAPEGQPLRQIAEQYGFHVYDYRKPRFYSTSIEIGQRRIPNPFAILYNLFVILRDALILRRFVYKQQIDVLYTGSMMGHIMAYLVRRTNRRVRVVFHFQELVSSGVGRRIFRTIASGADRIITVSQAVSSVLQGAGRVTLVYNGSDINQFKMNQPSTLRDELHLTADIPIVGIVGRLTPWKGHMVFLDAAQIMVKNGSNCHFAIIGDSIDPVTGESPYRSTLESYSARLGIENRVTFLGHRKDTSNIMSGVDVLVVPSIRPEPFGLVATEAMASGKPVVASNIGGLPEIVVDGVTGRLFIPGDPAALAEALASFVDNSGLRKQWGQAGRERVEAHFTLDRYIAAIADVFSEVAHSG
jgi:glycosyltransferase involved in cell wall biosynthesis